MFAIDSLRNRIRRKHPPRSWQPRLEELEERTLPALVNVTALTSGFTPNANNYTLLNNAIRTAKDGDVLVLSGNFDWTEPNAFNNWALGSDGTAGTTDDFFLTVPRRLDDVAFGATSPGGASITGPGNRPATDIEGFLRFFAGAGEHNRGWTITNLQISGFNSSIAMINGAGSPNNAFSGTQVTNNAIQVATAVNATAAGAPIVTPNVGILLGFGKDQKVANNTIDFAGNGVSDTPLNHPATSIGILSKAADGDVYDGLDIEGNTLRVLNDPSADPENLVGIWENGNASASNITVKDNQFVNLDAENDPTRNMQFGFLVTSHSGASTTVTYSGNQVRGANVAFDWAAGAGVDFSGKQPVQLIDNTATDVGTGVVVQSNGSALLQHNAFAGHGSAGGTGVDVEAGATANFVAADGGNQVSGFLSGIDVKGSAAVSGALLTGNGVGLRVSPGGGLTTLTGSAITGNAVGVLITSGAGGVGNLQFNTISGNSNFGVDNLSATTVNAAPNFWGDATGPRQPVLNPSGLGNPVSDHVQFTPFGTDPNDFARVTSPPGITFLSLSPATLNEGQVTTLTGTFTDADTTEAHTLQIDWGDGSATTSFVGPGGGNIGPFTHLYTDDRPTGQFTVTVKVTDEFGARDVKATSVRVDDLPPTFGSLNLVPTAPLENQPLALAVRFNNAGTRHTFTAVVDWNDGSPKETFTLPAGATEFAPRHVYATAGTYTVNVSLVDPSGGGFTATQPVKVAPATAAAFQRRFVERLFLDLLGRPVPSATLATLLGRLNRGMSREKLTLKLQQTNDYRVKVVQDLYLALLGRPASPAELLRQVRALGRRGSFGKLEASLIGTPEYYSQAGSPVSFLEKLYRDVAGQEIGQQQMGTLLVQLKRGVPRSTVAKRVLAGGAARLKILDDLFERLLLRPPTPEELPAALRTLRIGGPDLLIATITSSEEYYDLF
jgi:hypothetical protein